MPETQRQRVPRDDGSERDIALAFLSFARGCVIKKTDDLSDEQLRRPMVATGTSLLGLVQHLTDGERFWLGHFVTGRGEDDYDFSMLVPPERSAAGVLADYREAIAASDAILADVDDLGRPSAMSVEGRHHSVRWVLAHMTGETTRHAGHADILRELIDGTTGR